MKIALDDTKAPRRSWSGRFGVAAPFALIFLGSLLGAPAPASAEECIWGQSGYRDCVDKLLAENRKKEAGEVSAASKSQENATPGSLASNDPPAKKPPAKTSGKTTGKTAAKGRRPGAGSLYPVPPAELRLTNPNTDPVQDAIASERRQRQMDENRLRYDRPVPSPIMPPNYNTTPNTFGRICPQWGC